MHLLVNVTWFNVYCVDSSSLPWEIDQPHDRRKSLETTGTCSIFNTPLNILMYFLNYLISLVMLTEAAKLFDCTVMAELQCQDVGMKSRGACLDR